MANGFFADKIAETALARTGLKTLRVSIAFPLPDGSFGGVKVPPFFLPAGP
jgi:hypothetical protein